ncbi:universal stress protein [Poseidonocella sp. HB161398]|uniref:universal stress protein n=1 Tax=Poseidonocella sp. HB161398 TaxID=2320855 RepID=UPI0011083179|nr:universal stress protein [Poseidonocella sp. HB161398]
MYSTVLLAYDGSREGRLALREGAKLAQACGARVVLLAVVEYPDVFGGDASAVYVAPDRTDEVQDILDEGAARLVRMGVPHEARLERGQAAERITDIARQTGADLVVVGHHKQGAMARWLRGSVTTALSDSLNCSLLVARLEISDEQLFGDRPR